MARLDPEATRAYHKKRYQEKKDHILSLNAAWRAANPDRMASLRKNWKASHRDRVNECQNVRRYEDRPAVQAEADRILFHFEILPAETREQYALWLLNQTDNTVRRAVNLSRVDMALADSVSF